MNLPRFALGVALLVSSAAVAQTRPGAVDEHRPNDRSAQGPTIERGTTFSGLTFNFGIAHELWDGVTPAGFSAVGFRVGRFFGEWLPGPLRGHFAWESEILPVFLMHQETSTYGVSTTLLGSHYFRAESRFRPFLSFGAGLVVSSGDIPADASRLNFTPQVGFGIAFAHRGQTVYAIEYRLHHTSNASLAEHNPGINSSFFQFSFSTYTGGR